MSGWTVMKKGKKEVPKTFRVWVVYLDAGPAHYAVRPRVRATPFSSRKVVFNALLKFLSRFRLNGSSS